MKAVTFLPVPLNLLVLATICNAHFNLNYPQARGFDEDKLATFPCGGQDSVSSTRTPWPLNGGAIALEMGHITTNVEVLMAVGSAPTTDYNTVLRATFKETGLGAFCMTDVRVPTGMNITAGTNATIQVVTNGDPNGGLYNCADITFTDSIPPLASNVCTNATGLTVAAATVKGNPNETTASAPTTSTKSGAVTRWQVGLGGLMVSMAVAIAMAW